MNSGLISLGGGTLSGACKIGTDNIIIVKKGGALRKIQLRGKNVNDLGIVGRSVGCYIFPAGTVFFDPEVRFEANNQ